MGAWHGYVNENYRNSLTEALKTDNDYNIHIQAIYPRTQKCGDFFLTLISIPLWGYLVYAFVFPNLICFIVTD
jgi:hypothetical protein